MTSVIHLSVYLVVEAHCVECVLSYLQHCEEQCDVFWVLKELLCELGSNVILLLLHVL